MTDLVVFNEETIGCESVEVVHARCTRCPQHMDRIVALPYREQITINGLLCAKFAAACPGCGDFLVIFRAYEPVEQGGTDE